MDTTILGRTGLMVSVMGLGCGGPSRLGQSYERPEAESIRVVECALDLGVNVIDTAEAYRTEEIVGKGIRGVRREDVILSTKKSIMARGEGPASPEALRKGLEESLRRLDTDYVDVYHFHAVHPDQYDYVRNVLVPEAMRLRDEGKLRFIGVTEYFEKDQRHEMLDRALGDDCWDVFMVGFNILNQSAREAVFARAIEQNIGILDMFAVRRAFSRPERLKEILRDLIEAGQVDSADLDMENPLGFVVESGAAESLSEAAYRFCRHEPGMHVVLSGTGSLEHLEENARALNQPPLPEKVHHRLREIFRKADLVTGS
ncbi:aldo/keto reductase [bacterium]|nr:aldo/keto reductase [bacterium]